MTKQFTATAVLMLQRDGLLSLSDTIGTYVDGMPDWADQVTLDQLIHHTSRIPDFWVELDDIGIGFTDAAGLGIRQEEAEHRASEAAPAQSGVGAHRLDLLVCVLDRRQRSGGHGAAVEVTGEQPHTRGEQTFEHQGVTTLRRCRVLHLRVMGDQELGEGGARGLHPFDHDAHLVSIPEPCFGGMTSGGVSGCGAGAWQTCPRGVLGAARSAVV